MRCSRMDVIGCNEAFAMQNLAVIKELEKQTGEKVDMNKWNPLGGAIAFGHANGASGARCAMFAMGAARTHGRPLQTFFIMLWRGTGCCHHY